MSDNELRDKIEACRAELASYEAELKRRAGPQSEEGQARGRGSNHCQHTCLNADRDDDALPRQASSSAPVVAEHEPVRPSLATSPGSADTAYRSANANPTESEEAYRSLSPSVTTTPATDENAVACSATDVEEIYALLEEADENLEHGALWAVRLGLQRAGKLLGDGQRC